MSERIVGVIGATSLVGDCLLPLLVQSGVHVVAYSRSTVVWHGAHQETQKETTIAWRTLAAHAKKNDQQPAIHEWIIVAPIWVIPEHFAFLDACGARRIVALSSTSVFVKGDSSDPGEQRVAAKLAQGEAALQAWAELRGVQWLVLRPTLIYGLGRDQNISAAARFIRRFGFFPLMGTANGLRQPLHADDVAMACRLALDAHLLANRAYNISGHDTMPFRDMIAAVFRAMDKKPRFIPLPMSLIRLAIHALRLLPGFSHITASMAERMNRDLVFDHAAATRDFGFSPRPFRLCAQDLPS